jgi:hypothetical protein
MVTSPIPTVEGVPVAVPTKTKPESSESGRSPKLFPTEAASEKSGTTIWLFTVLVGAAGPAVVPGVSFPSENCIGSDSVTT